jgi:hypothetical protein
MGFFRSLDFRNFLEKCGISIGVKYLNSNRSVFNVETLAKIFSVGSLNLDYLFRQNFRVNLGMKFYWWIKIVLSVI